MSEGAWVLVAVVLVALAFGASRGVRDGRFRGTHEVRRAEEARPAQEAAEVGEGGEPVSLLLDGALGELGILGERGTLLQFSSAFCAPCRTTRRVLAEVAQVVPGVAHVEVDAEQHLELTRRLNIARTPTTLILDGHGREVSRATGAPRKEAVLATLAHHLPE